jgi:hypothetical protein
MAIVHREVIAMSIFGLPTTLKGHIIDQFERTRGDDLPVVLHAIARGVKHHAWQRWSMRPEELGEWERLERKLNELADWADDESRLLR